MEDTRAGKWSSWKVLPPLEGTEYTSTSPTGPRAAAMEQEEEEEVKTLGKSLSLSFKVKAGGRSEVWPCSWAGGWEVILVYRTVCGDFLGAWAFTLSLEQAPGPLGSLGSHTPGSSSLSMLTWSSLLCVTCCCHVATEARKAAVTSRSSSLVYLQLPPRLYGAPWPLA